MRLISILTFIALLSCQHKKDIQYSVRSELLCAPEQGKFLDERKFEQYGLWHPYDTVRQVNGDSVTISFDFITECCMDFTGSVDLSHDTLKLLYHSSNDSLGCDCYCDYRMIYKIKNKNLSWSSLKILYNDGRHQSGND